MEFDLTKIKSFSHVDRQTIESFILNGELNGREFRVVGELLGTIQVKSIIDRLIGALSHLSPYLREKYLKNRAISFKEYFKNKELVEIKQGNKTDSIRLIGKPDKDLKKQLFDQFIKDCNFTRDEPTEKVEFVVKQLDDIDVGRLLSQIRKFPIVQQAFLLLANKYEEWAPEQLSTDSKITLLRQLLPEKSEAELQELLSEHAELTEQSPEQIQRIKSELAQLHKQLDIISLAIEKASQSNEQELLKLSLEDLMRADGNSLEEKLSSYLASSKVINFDKKFLKFIRIRTSNTMIEKTAEVFEATREAKLRADPSLFDSRFRANEGTNDVYQINYTSDINNKKSKAFFKLGPKGEEGNKAAKDLEKLMWDIAGIFGIEKHFAPTKRTSLLGQAGNLQTGQGVKSLKENIKSKNPIVISKNQIIDGTLITLLFGMFDAHGENIRVEQDGTLKFFDNNRSLPSSNMTIKWGDFLLHPYRSNLLKLTQSYEPFTNPERLKLKNAVQDFKLKFALVEKYFNQNDVKAFIATLPPGWFSTEDSLEALKERIYAMERAIEDPNVNNLRDLVISVYPTSKFYLSLEFLKYIRDKGLKNAEPKEIDQLQKNSNSLLGFHSLSELLDTCLAAGINPKKILEFCQNQNLSFDLLLKNIWDLYRNSSQYNHFLSEKIDVYNSFENEAKIDLKDILE
jgi:hypothetical protein